ncbi:MAG TPA: extracellular solute-binding protein, partial [Limnochordia bacterium]
MTIVLNARAGSTTGKWSSWETLYRRLIEQFETEHPNIHVEYRSDWDPQKITVQMAAGVAPDIFEFWGAFGYAWAQEGSLLDFTPYVRRDWTEEDIRNFYPPQWEAGIVRFGPHTGERYGIPKYSNASVVYFNADLFANAGLTLPPDADARGNWTYDTFYETARKLTVVGADGRTERYGMNMCITCDGRYASFVWGYGGQVFELPNHPERFRLDEPEGIGAMEYIARLR